MLTKKPWGECAASATQQPSGQALSTYYVIIRISLEHRVYHQGPSHCLSHTSLISVTRPDKTNRKTAVKLSSQGVRCSQPPTAAAPVRTDTGIQYSFDVVTTTFLWQCLPSYCSTGALRDLLGLLLLAMLASGSHCQMCLQAHGCLLQLASACYCKQLCLRVQGKKMALSHP